MSQQSFHFTLGPVQGFVSQARRTRDFWAGSFLLSWLSGVAMLAVQKQDGEIEFPSPPAGYLDWIGGQGAGDAPRQGAIPNRFKARVGEDFNAGLIAQTVREAWKALAERVWIEDLQNIGESTPARIIWERQHENFWEISWILTDGEAADVLDRRKNWRDHLHFPEPGVKCMVMDGWQELSGAERPNSKEQQDFWRAVRAQPGRQGLQTDLAEGERLCAITFVKRRFAWHFEGLETEVCGLPLRGWKLSLGVPSVSYMAAVHWLEAVLRHPDKSAVLRVLQAAQALDRANDEWETRIRCLEEARRQHEISRALISRDGSVFFGGVRDDASREQQQAQQKQVQELSRAVKSLKIDAPLSPFYAILLMDGDSLGVHMGDREKQPKIAASLNRFTHRVPGVVQEHNGFLIYAGGDDVLAVLPLEDALPCAKELRDGYLQAFGGTGIPSTLSGAVEFAHIKMPLGRVLADAHILLDHVAKDGCGRDSIAVRVWTPGGCALEWGQPWDIAMENSQDVTVQQIAATFAEQDAETPFSNKFFYKIRERFELLNPTPEQPKSLLTEEQAVLLIAADYLSSGVNDRRPIPLTLVEAKNLLQPLLRQCRPQKRMTDENGLNAICTAKESQRLDVDDALLVRFLARKGVDRGGDGSA